jgi:hypothetical protein
VTVVGVRAVVFFLLLSASVLAQGIGGGGGAGYENLEKPKFVGVPIPTYNESFGFGLGLVGTVMYNVSSTDTISPPSSTGLFGFAATNETWALGAWQQLYLREDKYRLTAAAGYVSVNFQVWAPPAAPSGGSIDYNTNAFFGVFKGLVETWHDIYLGGIYRLITTRTRFDLGEGVEIPEQTFSGLGPMFAYDSRDNIFYPYSGWNVELQGVFFRAALGSDTNYNAYEVAVNRYIKLGDRSVLAARATVDVATGDVPFTAQSVMMGPDLRGYANGKYRADQKYTVQAEYRWQFHGRWGLVGFGGFGWVTDRFSDIRFEDILPSVGAGLRFTAIEEWHVNAAMDVAAGKDDVVLYFKVGEAF